MGVNMKQVSIRLADREVEHLKRYCEITERNQNDVLRELIRSLLIKGVLNPLN
jgi:predicted DNA-binding protein